MIVFVDILGKLNESGYSCYRLRREKLLGEATLTRIRNGADINTSTLDVICRLCHCQPGELIRWEPDEERE